MKQLTEDAQKRLDKYNQEVRLCLQGIKTVEPDEILRDITEHIENELESAQEPVSCSDLESVLNRLGSPQQWVPTDELSWFRKISLRLRTGPDDWRLAYITLAVFVISCISGPGVIILLPLSFYLARTTLKIAGGFENLGNQKYLIMPPLACFYVIYTVLELGFPFLLFVLAEAMKNSFQENMSEYKYWFMAWTITIAAVGLWWFIIGAIHSRFTRLTDVITTPFGIGRKLGTIIMISGIILVISSVSTLLFFLPE